ncbi:MAG: tetratricopeptide repeat protein [Sandaracinaceae bacterium]|nr:tetratricopeptide repeat protein [Sandaracinaceae bacterium]
MIDDDDDLRGRLGALADEGAPRLDEAARRRVLTRVEAEGPALVRGSRGRWYGLAIGLAAAAALILWVVSSRPAEPVAEGPACAGWGAASANVYEGRLDLGRRGLVRVEGELALRAVDGCATDLELTSGTVNVRADDLGGGTLRVLAGDVTVEVRGTRFTVTRDAAHVAVAVEEGHVVVRAPSEREIHLRVGERWSRGAPQAAVEPAPVAPVAPLAEAPALPSELEAAPTPTTSPRAEPAPARPDDRARLAEAERLWREGDRDGARAIFRRVGAGRGALAEAAWVRLARLELRAGDPARAAEAARSQRQRFPNSHLGAEALWIEADAARRAGDAAGARAAIAELRERYPDSPQARAVPGAPTP